MNKPMDTKTKLLNAAKTLFWTRGYSNVSVRDITKSAGVDAALVSRYFGGKQGLFEATLADLPAWDALAADRDDLLTRAAESFCSPYDPEADQANPFTMLLTNIVDPEMGDSIRQLVRNGLSEPLVEKLGGEAAREQAAMLLAVLFGVALMRKQFQLPGFTDKSSQELNTQLMHLGQAALSFKG